MEIQQLSTLLRSRGMRVTAQRVAVLDVIQASVGHLSAEQVHQQVREKIPHISLATVYKALNELREVGKIKALPVSGKLRFDLERGAGHHHLICEGCKRVEDVFAVGGFREPRLDDDKTMGFEITGTEITFMGICPECREPTASNAASK